MQNSLGEWPSWRRCALLAVKVFHTELWAFFVLCILALPLAAWLRRFDWALILTICVLVECATLALNHWRCPLTNLAARFTDERDEAFDIFLPKWLAKWNKYLFGAIFFIGELFVLWRWLH